MATAGGRATAEFRFYEELNDFLEPVLRKKTFAIPIDRGRSVKDAIESVGIPHTQVDLIVVDGAFAWVYFPSNDAKTVLKTSADQSAGGRDFHREFLEDPESKYEVTYEGVEEVVGRTTYRLRMVPKRPMSYRFATVWIDQGAPVLRRLQMEEANGNIRTVTLDNVGFGADPGTDYFTFTPPQGALVMVR